MKRTVRYILVLFVLIFFCALWIPRLGYMSESSRLDETLTQSEEFRSQTIDEWTLKQIGKMEAPGEYLAVYWLENDFGAEDTRLLPDQITDKRRRWERSEGWSSYLTTCQAVWDDLVCFPVAASDGNEPDVTFEDSWMFERTYKEERGHEGTDIMSADNERGVLPVVSMTDGVVEKKGWLELGGYRIGIRAPHGGYFYYAHMDSYADIEVGDEVRAGDLLGYMGDTGYGEEGTKGKFPVHLHLGIYITTDAGEISVDPYAALRHVK